MGCELSNFITLMMNPNCHLCDKYIRVDLINISLIKFKVSKYVQLYILTSLITTYEEFTIQKIDRKDFFFILKIDERLMYCNLWNIVNYD